jgi:hypothetical protein
MSRHETEDVVTVVSIILYTMGYTNGIQLAKFVLLIDRTSPIYLIVRLQALSSVIV